MPAALKGNAIPLKNGYGTRVQLGPGRGTRKMFRLDFTIDGRATKAEADARDLEIKLAIARLRRSKHAERIDLAQVLEDLASAVTERELGDARAAIDDLAGPAMLLPGPREVDAGPTFGAFAMQWVRGELAARYGLRRKRSAGTDLTRLTKYVFPIVGDVPIASFTRDHYEQIQAGIPERAGARKLKASTRRQICQVVRKVLELAVEPARLIERNPVPASALPAVRGKGAANFTYLYPDEDARILATRSIDLGFRVLLGFAHRLGWRREEMLGGTPEEVEGALPADEHELDPIPPMTWSRVDLDRGFVYIDRDKTRSPRPIAMDQGLRRALAAWKELHPQATPEDYVFLDEEGTPIDPEKVSRRLRAALKAAGVDRARLFGVGGGRRITWHDTRAAFVTVALANDRPERWVRDRTGHTSSALERYVRVARTIQEAESASAMGDWKPLDEAIPELSGALGLPPGGSANDTSLPSAPAEENAVEFLAQAAGAEGFGPLSPESSASANSATFARRRSILNCGRRAKSISIDGATHASPRVGSRHGRIERGRAPISGERTAATANRLHAGKAPSMTTSASLHEALVEHATIDHRFRDLFAALLAKDASAAAIAERLFATVRAHFAAEEAHIARFAAVDAAEAAALRAEHHELDAMMRGLEEALAGAGLSTHDVVEFKARFSLHEAREETGFYRRMRVAG